MDVETQVRLVKDLWSDHAEKLLSGALDPDDSTYTIEELKKEVQAGKSELFRCELLLDDGWRLLGWGVLFIEDFGGGRECVFQAGASLTHAVKSLKVAIPAVEEWARSNGCVSVRTHIVRGRGSLKRAFLGVGFKEVETVLRAKL
ncbi:hypothetical protein [Magnetococcus sp. PR-3]|uniref:hypothetical protein n=1 Tax=Magnetococcus sp. PR-3 TaxID=3120355 RepID=UPI002FCDE454